VVSHCANPECGNEFLYLRDGELFVIKPVPQSSTQYYWLCSSCAGHLRVVHDPRTGVAISSRLGMLEPAGGTVPGKKPANGERFYGGSTRQMG
jgi:hypothetical protein